MVCLNCEKSGCRISSCREPCNFERIARNKVLSFACPHRNRRANVSFAETPEELSEELNEVLFCSESDGNDVQDLENPEQKTGSDCYNTGFVAKCGSEVQHKLDSRARELSDALDGFDVDSDEECF